MKDKIKINGIKLKKINKNYYISKNGDVYSFKTNKFLKHIIDKKSDKPYPYVDIDGKHKRIHHLVYETWVGPILKGYQINHKDDNQLNNHLSNLYMGNQQQNIMDQFKNKHRVGAIHYLILYDFEVDAVINFCPSKDFIEYSGHSNKNGSVKKMFKKNWFKKRYIILEFSQLKSYKEIESVTTKCEEFNKAIG